MCKPATGKGAANDEHFGDVSTTKMYCHKQQHEIPSNHHKLNADYSVLFFGCELHDTTDLKVMAHNSFPRFGTSIISFCDPLDTGSPLKNYVYSNPKLA